MHLDNYCNIYHRLVYIRKSQIKEVLCPVTEDDIPHELTERLQEEKKIELVKRREKNEAHLYMTLRILLEDAFCGHQVSLNDLETELFLEGRVNYNYNCPNNAHPNYMPGQ